MCKQAFLLDISIYFLGKHIKCKTICFIMHMRTSELHLDYLNM